MSETRSDAVVLFGASGDLAYKKLFPSLYHLAAKGRLGVPVIGVGRSDWTGATLADRARSSITEHVESHRDTSLDNTALDSTALDEVVSRMRFVSGDYSSGDLYPRLGEALADCSNPLFYLAIPPSLFDDVVSGLDDVGLAERSRVVVEKPFGRDLDSARELNDVLARSFDEHRTFRIDHFLGKEPVQNLLVFRFANSILEPVWNRHHVASVTITMVEAFGIDGRGGFFDSVGALRDVVQNHLLEIVMLLAMDAPNAITADALRDEKLRVLQAIRSIRPQDVVRGQYLGYLDEDGVGEDSVTETFVDLTLFIENWRWSGVPFRLRAGKAMSQTLTEAVVEFVEPPTTLFCAEECPPRNQLRFTMKPHDTIGLSMQAKTPGGDLASSVVELTVSSQESLGDGPAAYEQLLDDAMDGDTARFGRRDAIEEQWRIVGDVLDGLTPPTPYEPGSNGPEDG